MHLTDSGNAPAPTNMYRHRKAKDIEAKSWDSKMAKTNLYWPEPVQWVCLSFLCEKRQPRKIIQQFYTKVIEELASQCKKQLFEGLNFCKYPLKWDYVDVKQERKVAELWTELIEKFASPQQKNAFFVLVIYDDDVKTEVLDFANQLVKLNRFAVAMFPAKYVDYLPRTDRNFSRKDESFHKTLYALLMDIILLVVNKKNEMRLRGEPVRPRVKSPTGASDMFDEDDDDASVRSVDSDGTRLMLDGVSMPSTPKPFEIHLAENFPESGGGVASSSSATLTKPAVNVVVPQVLSSKQSSSSCVGDFSSKPPNYSTSKKVAEKLLFRAPVAPTTSSSTSSHETFDERQIVRQVSSRLSHAKSENNLSSFVRNAPTSTNSETAPPQRRHRSPTLTVPVGEQQKSQQQQEQQQPSQLFNDAPKRIYQSTFKQLALKQDEFYDVLVTHVSNPSEFYAQLFVHREYLEWLSFRMQVFYSLVDDIGDLSLSIDDVRQSSDIKEIWCAAPYQEVCPNGIVAWRYYRAKLLRRLSPTIFQVMFMDYGDTAELPLNALKQLPESFCTAGELAVHCRLSQANIPEDVLLAKVQSKSNFVMRIEKTDEEPMIVSLFSTDGKDDINVGEFLSAQLRSITNGGGDKAKSIGIGRGRKQPTPCSLPSGIR